MADPKFRKFYGVLWKWLDETHKLTVAERLFFPSPRTSVHEAVPDVRKLWRSYLKVILPPKFISLLHLNAQFPDNLANGLLAFSNYAVERKIAEIVESVFTGSVSPGRRKKLVERVLNFHYNLPKWADGFWHSRIIKDRESAFNHIKTEIFETENDWSCALFLSEAGYRYPSSISSFKAWSKWSGIKSDGDDYRHWRKCLKSVSGDFDQVYRIDFIMNLIFSGRSFFSPSDLCREPSFCRLCPLSPDCRYFKNNRKPGSDLEDLLRADNEKEIETVDLIKYLAGRRWKDSEEQRSFLENISDLRYSFSPDMQRDDEKLLLFLLGVRELANRFQDAESLPRGEELSSSRRIYEHLKYKLGREFQESFYTLILDNRYRVIRLQLITKGTLNESPIHPREVFAPAVQLRAAAVVLIHNHPSGDISPSRRDVEITKRLRDVGDIVGIKILDHVIIGGNKHFSFMDEGLIT